MAQDSSHQEVGQEEGISVWEADCHLNSKLFLNEYPRWRADSPQHPYILQQMFAHAEEVGKKEQEQVICQGCQHWVPREDAEVKTSAIQMVGFWTTWEEIQGIYNEVYQEKRLPGPLPYGPRWDGKPLTRKSVLLWKSRTSQKQGAAKPERRSTGSHCTYSAAQPPAEFHFQT